VPGLEIQGDSDVLVRGITLDSRSVRAGDLFAALPGTNFHGVDFVAEARSRGAAAIFTDGWGANQLAGDTCLIAQHPRDYLGSLSATIFGDPGRDLTLVGVTGTNGKTTVSHLVFAGLREAGMSTGLIGTAGIHINDESLPSVRTTPEAPELHRLLAHMRDRGVQAVSMEVSSHALSLGRVDALRFDIAAFTNLSQDHLDFHGSMEEYFRAKSMLFEASRCARAVICIDDVWGQRLAQECKVPTTTVAGLALDSDTSDADVVCTSIEERSDGTQFVRVRTAAGEEHSFNVSLPGRFNATNAVLAWTILRLLSVQDAVIATALGSVRVPGRMEVVEARIPATVIVDYAHTPDAVERAMQSVKVAGRRIVVLGCGGDRDREKRPQMGRIAASLADVLIVTDDNPRGEEPSSIRAAMMSGVEAQHQGRLVEVGDRREAIERALAMADVNDVVMVLGKGHESGQEIAGIVHPFDDREVIRHFSGGRPL
jgi:UDP-N-acetylmuramoyl-L-alanyl-D-glutamate--2,6-diaminopimelate ligase